MDLEKLKKDRKLLRGIDNHVASRSTLVAFAYLFVFGLVGWSGELIERHPRFMIVIGLLLIVPMVWRSYCTLRFEQSYGAAPARWRQSFMVVNLFHVTMYALLCFSSIVLIDNPKLISFLLVCTIGIVLISTDVWRPFRRMNEAFTAICLMPFVVGALLEFSFLGLLLALTIVGIFVNQIMVIKRGYDDYWWGLYHGFLLKEKAKDLETAERKIRRMGEGRIDLLSDLTHEIRTPMNSVLGMLTLLLDSGLDESQKEIVTVAHHSGDSMLSLIDDILDFSRIASGTIVLVSSVFNLRHCIDDTLELLGPVAHAKGIDLSSVYDSDVPVRVRGDAHRIGQILNNLVSNAIKFSEEGEVVVTVHMTRLSGEEGLLRIHVIDQGVGISPEKQDELFRAFHKADASTTRKHGGTGLGLAISKGLVEAMQGQIGLISELGKGSTFWFTGQLMLSTQQVASLPPIKEFAGQRALIVGAPMGLNESLRQELDSWGIDSDSLDEGYDKALQLLRERAREQCEYHLLIANLGHHYTGNLKLIQIISEDPVLRGTRQILLTTLEQRGIPSVKQTVDRSEHVVLVTKPIQRRHLYQALSRLYGVEKETRAVVYAGTSPQETLLQKFSVLVVEDNKVNQMVASGMLNRLGYQVKIVDNGKQAIGILTDKHFDLVLMDCHMPELDGYSATSALREMERETGNHVPVIGMTANTGDGEETRCLAAGMDDVLLKPISIEELDSKLRLWLLQEESETGIFKRIAQSQDSSPPGIH